MEIIKKALEKVVSEDLADIWSILESDQKRRIVEVFELHDFKKIRLFMPSGRILRTYGYFLKER